MTLPAHRRLTSGRTFAAPYDPAAYGCAIEAHYSTRTRLARWLRNLIRSNAS